MNQHSSSQESSQRTVVRAAQMLDVRSGELLKNVVVVVEKARIEAVSSNTAVPDGYQLDLGDLTLLPGLIDMHVHLSYDWESLNAIAQETSADAALRGARNARATLLAGFTTARNVGSHDFVDVALMRAIDAGFIDGPRIVPVGHSLTCTGGYHDLGGGIFPCFAPGLHELGAESGIADGPDALRRAVRYQIKYGAKAIKVVVTAGVLATTGPAGAQQYSDEELRAIVEETHRHGLKVAAHTHGTAGILAALRAGVDSIEHGSMVNDEAIRWMKEHGTYLVPTSSMFKVFGTNLDSLPGPIRERRTQFIALAQENQRRAIQAGVKIAVGTDAPVLPHGSNAREFSLLVELGMAPLEAIRAATLSAADLLATEDRGLIEPGRFADMIAVPGDPLRNIKVLEDVRFVMQGGKVIKLL
jgi:imidazolonepropionase-like amidohydrolase